MSDFHGKDQSVNAIQGNNVSLLQEAQETHKTYGANKLQSSQC